jgi:hypothetical protein
MGTVEKADQIVKETPKKTLKKINILSRFKYPKLFFLVLSIIAAYIIFQNPAVSEYVSSLGKFGYLTTFFAGMLFAFGFSAAIAVGFFITINPGNIYLAALIAGVGALLSDMIIFRFIKISFEEEFNNLKESYLLRKISELSRKHIGVKLTSYFVYAFAGIMIASPLPDEVGVILLAGLTKVKQKILAIISFVLNTAGIFLILYFTHKPF